MTDTIIDLALSYNFWIYGGWIRDVVCHGDKTPSDIDIMVPESEYHRVDHFLRVLGMKFPGQVTFQSETSGAYFTTGRHITKVYNVRVKDVDIDITFYDGELEDWKDDRTVDLSCNLFYMTREIPLGIRYVPWSMRHVLNPAKELIRMTREGEFTVIYEPGDDDQIKHVMRRAFGMVCRGWSMAPNFINDQIWQAVKTPWAGRCAPWLVEMMRRCTDEDQAQKLRALHRATNLPEEVMDEVRRHLNFNVS
jgi:hypothetical protein